MRRRIFVIGDIEMGKGDLLDDFHDDDELSRFIAQIVNAERTDEVTLVLNGDVFDFLKMDYQGEFPRYITQEISEWKFLKVLQTHPKFFIALKKFLEFKHTKLVFVIGNHDADVAWPEMQNMICDILGNGERIQFVQTYDEQGLNIQHGNLVDPLFTFPYERPIIKYMGKRILNLPFGYHVATQYLIHLKKKFHNEEKLYPQQAVFKKHPGYKKAIDQMMYQHALQIFLLDPLKHHSDPMYRVPYLKIVEHVLMNGFDGIHDDRFLNFSRLRKKFGNKQLYVLSHAHVLKDVNNKNSRFIITDCWREELNIETPNLEKKPKIYVEIELADDTILQADVKVFLPLGVKKIGGV